MSVIRAWVHAALHGIARYTIGFKSFGKGSIVKPWPRLISGARFVSIGQDCFFGDGLVLVATSELNGVRHNPSCTIGNRCVFGSDAVISCTGSITLGDNILTSLRIFIGDSYHGYEDIGKPVLDQPMAGEAPITIGDGCFLGIGCVILPGTRLGKNCYVGANAVVSGTFPDYTVIVGNPGRAIKSWDGQTQRWVATR